ncbi:hypothetical protein D5R55_09390 [Burkholderia cenocepacia]|uniref:Lipoprotein n=1 Tax=Burkholderia cenocepacia TaxID=95486 RepID=A0A3Q9F2M6_9BURK|nr:hypothetical protein D5R55_09390 [Burkholderia cenocepacia]
MEERTLSIEIGLMSAGLAGCNEAAAAARHAVPVRRRAHVARAAKRDARFAAARFTLVSFG